jgi:hypothetical protein
VPAAAAEDLLNFPITAETIPEKNTFKNDRLFIFEAIFFSPISWKK